MLVVPALLARGTIVSEYISTFLLAIRRRDQQFNIGAAVTDRRQIKILVPKDLALSMHEATELQKRIREAVVDASLRQF